MGFPLRLFPAKTFASREIIGNRTLCLYRSGHYFNDLRPSPSPLCISSRQAQSQSRAYHENVIRETSLVASRWRTRYNLNGLHDRHASTRASHAPSGSELRPASAINHSLPVGSPDSGVSIDATPNPTASYAAPVGANSTGRNNRNPSSKSPVSLSWNDFLSLRQTRRRYNLLASILCGGTTLTVGLSTLSTFSLDTFNVMGADPLVIMGLSTLATGAIGWILGPFLGGTVFNIVNSRLRREIARKEKSLYERILKYRVDPSNSSAGNPVPDFYGEKIGSVAQYRTWLKDQRAYRKKRQSFV